jgi:hypothetical protein
VPRQNRRRGDDPGPLDAGSLGRGVARTEDGADGAWVVRTVTGAAATKTYRCPGCDHEIRPGTPHVVTWPAEERSEAALDRRRHWHTPCWRARSRRAAR